MRISELDEIERAVLLGDNTQTGRFGQIKREGYFLFRGLRWKRTRGRFAVPVHPNGSCGYEVYFDINTGVKPCT